MIELPVRLVSLIVSAISATLGISKNDATKQLMKIIGAKYLEKMEKLLERKCDSIDYLREFLQNFPNFERVFQEMHKSLKLIGGPNWKPIADILGITPERVRKKKLSFDSELFLIISLLHILVDKCNMDTILLEANNEDLKILKETLNTVKSKLATKKVPAELQEYLTSNLKRLEEIISLHERRHLLKPIETRGLIIDKERETIEKSADLRDIIRAFIEENKGNIIMLDALYQFSLNPTSKTAGYALDENYERIESNLRIRYKGDFSTIVNKLRTFFDKVIENWVSTGYYDLYHAWIYIREEMRNMNIYDVFINHFLRKFESYGETERKILAYLIYLFEEEWIENSFCISGYPGHKKDMNILEARFKVINPTLTFEDIMNLSIEAGLVSKLYWLHSKHEYSCDEYVFHRYLKDAKIREQLTKLIEPIIEQDITKISEESIKESIKKLYNLKAMNTIRTLFLLACSRKGYTELPQRDLILVKYFKELIGVSEKFVAILSPRHKHILYNALKAVFSKIVNKFKTTVGDAIINYIQENPAAIEYSLLLDEDLFTIHQLTLLVDGEQKTITITITPTISLLQEVTTRIFSDYTIYFTLFDNREILKRALRQQEAGLSFLSPQPIIICYDENLGKILEEIMNKVEINFLKHEI